MPLGIFNYNEINQKITLVPIRTYLFDREFEFYMFSFYWKLAVFEELLLIERRPVGIYTLFIHNPFFLNVSGSK